MTHLARCWAFAYPESVKKLDWKSGWLKEGLDCFHRGEYFAAHEFWEAVWLKSEEPEKSFLQAMIQATAAFHHFQAGNGDGAKSLLRRAVRRMDACPECFGGLNVGRLRAELRGWLAALESEVPFPERIPQIRLKREKGQGVETGT